MEQRINVQEVGKEAFAALYPLGKYLKQSTLDQQLLHLIYFRVSQINGCAFCLDMHAKDLRAAGETEQRLYVLDAWREAPFYSDRERAALAWAEALTRLTATLIPDSIYEEVKKHFTEKELVALTLGVTAINTYNRINIAFGAPVGTYEVGQFA
ncbi:carboxymuconolactone decarboxylase family protein [Niabella aurantiaca]|uniref:carboxymuconolactone decarboxylase family protein n=1 Tax=Niabella aurantiaca TaxID=379900 RepID=UPI0003A07BB3|nr:carboxymuconolactone decarboxylase family protein [Niabella aurantiaca]